MGILDNTEWVGKWVGAPFAGGRHTTSPSPHLRHTFVTTKPVASARLYASAIGVYEAYLNGVRVGEDVLAPGWTDYHKRVQYQVYDVTTLINEGENAIGAIVGDGWAVGNIAWAGRQRYAECPHFMAQLIITYQDGDRQTVATGQNWKASAGPILESDFLMGESYDARRELSGWVSPGYDESNWSPVRVFDSEGPALVATNGPTMRRHGEIHPISMKFHPDFIRPCWIFDLGQNMVGRVRLKVSGPAGTTLTIRHSEALNPDGTLHTANLRSARNTDYYTLKGEAIESFEPHFVFHGFRYVEIGGLPGEPSEDTITGIVIHTDTPVTGTFQCSDPLINQLQSNIVWSQKGNFVDVPTDCPQRDERLGWTGDAQVFVRTAAFNMDVAGFFAKWMQDLEDAQHENGAYPAIAPNAIEWPISEGGPAWADAGIIIPWTMYQAYGDTRVLEKHYDSMRRYIEFLVKTSKDHIRCYSDYEGWHGFGDWLALDGSDGREGATPKEVIGTAFFAHSAKLMAKIATVLGRPQDAEHFDTLSNDVRTAFLKNYVNSDGTILGKTQTGYLLALHFDLLPQSMRANAVAHLVEDIQRRDNHLSTGFVGTPYINWVLSETGHLDLAYSLLKQTTWPSWLYSVTQGATTIWERWDGWTHDKGFQNPSMNSFNHYAYGAIGAWLYSSVGGIDFDPEIPGYKHIIMHPNPGGGLTSACADLHSQYGPIHSEWVMKNSSFDWRISIPANTTATVFVPAPENAAVQDNGEAADSADSISLLRREGNVAVYKVSSGDYHFTVRS
jgi:alpha-L-rhamnosidase